MSARHTAADQAASELARRRLSRIGAELARDSALLPEPAATDVGPPGRDAAPVPRRDEQAPPGSAGRHARQRLSWPGRASTRAADALPPGLRGRVRVSAQHVTVVALVLAAAMALAAWLLVRSAPEPLARPASLRLPAARASVAAPTSSAPTSGPAVTGVSAPATGAATSPASVVVHVVGRVRHPGVFELPGGARVVDAIDEAGGARPGARLSGINLARVLVDGEQIAVGIPGASSAGALGAVPAGVAPPTEALPGGLVNINTATQPELEELPGIGPVTATSIIEWRVEHGGFSTVDELLEVSGIGEVTLAELRDLVTP